MSTIPRQSRQNRWARAGDHFKSKVSPKRDPPRIATRCAPARRPYQHETAPSIKAGAKRPDDHTVQTSSTNVRSAQQPPKPLTEPRAPRQTTFTFALPLVLRRTNLWDTQLLPLRLPPRSTAPASFTRPTTTIRTSCNTNIKPLPPSPPPGKRKALCLPVQYCSPSRTKIGNRVAIVYCVEREPLKR